ncbi:MAG: DegT/DnrJ/EryC1/StrS aminotransferase family protein [Gemmatimonadetes bacterium]|nr:DegT/DnrJ/EryC1/StrS aminotransferase family protein [Gemmatimonadota bacterium]
MIPPKRIEIGWFDLVRALAGGVLPRDRTRVARQVEASFPHDPAGSYTPPRSGRPSEQSDALAVLSVRSGFDLLLEALDLPEGSEVVVSAITISDMPRIIREHGLVPVPVDLDMNTLSVSVDALRSTITHRTRAILVAHVFGSRMDLGPVAAVAREHGLLLVEDCAQAYDGCYSGAPEADVSMFSFGPIKTQTALGGGVLRVRPTSLLDTMRRLQGEWPEQPAGEYLRRVAKYALVLLVLTRPVYGVLVRLTRGQHQRFLKSAVRGFPGKEFFARIRRQPSVPLLATMARRLKSPDLAALAERRRQGRMLLEDLPHAVVPGHEAPHHSYWVFPVTVAEPAEAVTQIRGLGLDPSRGTTSLTVVTPPDGRPPPRGAMATMRNVLFLPLGPGLTPALAASMTGAVRRLQGLPEAGP